MKFNSIFANSEQTQTRKRTDDQDEDYLNMDFSDSIKMFNKPKTVNEVDAYIDQRVHAPFYYHNLNQFMRMMEPEDTIRIWLNTEGGYLSSALQIIDSMTSSKGKVIVVMSGDVMSAGSMIALGAPNVVVGEQARMMIHCARYGVAGKSPDIVDRVAFETRELHSIMKRVYEGFLTEDELTRVMEGKEMYFNADEIISRLEKRAEYQKNLIKESEKPAIKSIKSSTKRTKVANNS